MPRHSITAVPVDDGHQIRGTALHGNVGDVGTSPLIGWRDRQIAQQARANAVFRVCHPLARPGMHGLYARHGVHQTLGGLRVDRLTLVTQADGHPPDT